VTADQPIAEAERIARGRPMSLYRLLPEDARRALALGPWRRRPKGLLADGEGAAALADVGTFARHAVISGATVATFALARSPGRGR
jgi:hypothetical protein